MPNFIPNSQSEQPQVLQPNIKKIFYKNLLSVVVAVVVIIGIALWSNYVLDLESILSVFKEIGFSMNISKVIWYFVAGIAALSLIMIIGNYLVMKNVRYEFYKDKLTIYADFLLVFSNSKDIPYQNISRLAFNDKGIFNSIFNTGTIVIELSAMKENKVELNFVDNAPQAAQYIQNLLQRFRSMQQVQFTHEDNIGNILDRGFRY